MLATLAVLTMTADWKLAWSDEFDKAGRPDPAKWGYETGFIRNNEAQFYTKDRSENARIEGGKLVIEARKDNFENHPISSASLHTSGKKEFKYGKFEIRAKLPKGRGTWPAIWMLGNDIEKVGWPKCGELDIMEHVGFDPNKVHFNIHTKAYNHVRKTGKGAAIDFPTPEEWHVYGMEWYPDRVDFFLDGKKTFSFAKEKDDKDVWPFDKPHYLIINLAIGGGWGGEKGVDDGIFPARYEIDYVRYYEKA
ncbi:MAG: glycoside hydrolase family 16 protein [Fimbriimonas sp.]